MLKNGQRIMIIVFSITHRENRKEALSILSRFEMVIITGAM